MAGTCLVISDKTEDMVFGKQLAEVNQMQFRSIALAEQVQEFLQEHWGAVILIDGDNQKRTEWFLKIIKGKTNPLRVFVITNKTISHYPFLFEHTSYSHHLVRRFKDPAVTLYSKLLTGVLAPHPFGVVQYIEGKAQTQKIVLKHSGHKGAAVEALQNYFTKQQINRRLSTLAAKACDELIMNAIFDAPIDKKSSRYRKFEERTAQFELSAKEEIEVQVASNDKYVGICVSDQFGSLDKEDILRYIKQNYKKASYSVQEGIGNAAGEGLGLLGSLQSGLSMVFVVKPGVRTDVMIFFLKAQSYKDFKEGFQMLSLNAL